MAKEKSSNMSLQKQEVAYIFASHMQQVKSDKIAARSFVHSSERSRKDAKKQALLFLKEPTNESLTLSAEEREKVTQIRADLREKDQGKLDAKKGNFSVLQRAGLVFKADSKILSGLKKEERIEMYKKAGYDSDAIGKVTGEKLVLTHMIGNSLTPISETLRTGAAALGGSLPFVEQVPNNGITAGLAVAAYVGTLGIASEVNLKLTKEVGASAFGTLTTFYYLGDKLFPPKARDWLARSISQGGDYFLHAGIVGGMTIFSDGDLRKITAASLTMAFYNSVVGGACELWRRVSKRKTTK